MPTPLDPQAIEQAQSQDDCINGTLNDTSLCLQRLKFDNSNILCDVSAGFVRPYIPECLRKRAFDSVHNLSHSSGRVTAKQLCAKFVWPNIRKDATQWAHQCTACQRSKIHRHVKLPPKRIDVPDHRFDHIHIDLIVLPPVNELRYCLTVIDRFSRWPVAVPLKDIEAQTVAAALFNYWICQFGTPLTITTDQGSQFESALFRSLARVVGAQVIHDTPYHPQANGLVERLHRTLKAALMCQAPTSWPAALPTVLLGLRTCVKEDINASPAEMLFGAPLRIPGAFVGSEDDIGDAQPFVDKHRELMRNIRPTQTAIHAKSRCFVMKDLNSCSHVFRRVDSVRRPLDPPYTGPHEVVKRVDDRVFIIRIDGAEKAVSIETLKPAYLAKHDPSPAAQPLANGCPASTSTSAIQPSAKATNRVSFL